MLNGIDLTRADLNLLVLFESVLEERHVGRAAERLSLTPSAVSHGLGRLRRLLNDPLFLKTPKGVVPTERATQLSEPIADVLARVRKVIASAAPFDPATSTRRFTIGAPDGVSAVFLPPLLAEIHRVAPGIDIALRQLLPVSGETLERAWRPTWADLEARSIDIALIPSDDIPPRFWRHLLFEEDFVIAMRARHPLKHKPSLDRYCSAQHVVVSMTGDSTGFVDRTLAKLGRTRRVALTVPNFMFALTVVSQSDLVCALPRRFAAIHAAQFGVVTVDAPVPLDRLKLNIVAPETAMMDGGITWLVTLVQRTGRRVSQRRAS
jgi:DNA-binding transcriptional LysR family regulator